MKLPVCVHSFEVETYNKSRIWTRVGGTVGIAKASAFRLQDCTVAVSYARCQQPFLFYCPSMMSGLSNTIQPRIPF